MVSDRHQRLIRSWEWSRKQLQPFRERRRRLILQQVGDEYGPHGTNKAMPANLFDLALGIYRRNLAARNPVVDIRSRSRKEEVLANKLELAVNDTLEEIDFAGTLDRVVHDALFGLGIMKIGLTEGKTAEWMGVLHDAGMPFADHIDLDDFVVDMHARSWEAVQFIGNRFEVPYELAMDSKLYEFDCDPAPARPRNFNEYGDARTDSITRSDLAFEDTRAIDILELWEMYLPFSNEVLTFMCDDRGYPTGDPVRTVEWDGPEGGPYLHLALGDVIGQLIPFSPVAGLADLSDAVNRTLRKLVRQQDRQKTIGIVAGGAEEDGERIVAADDGDMIRVDRPEATREAKFGGIDQASMAFMIQLRDLFNYTGGNLDAIGGLSATADTLGQEEMIRKSSSQRIQDMQARVVKFSKKAMSHIASWIYFDPVSVYNLRQDIPGTNYSMDLDFKPKERKESLFGDFEFEIVPTTLQEQTPAQRLSTLNAVMSNYLVNLAPHLQQQGMGINVRKYVEHAADLTSTPELLDLVMDMQPPTPEQGGGSGGGPSGQPPETTRNYVRRNVGTGGTRAARDMALTQMLSGRGVTDEQAQMLQRPQAEGSQ